MSFDSYDEMSEQQEIHWMAQQITEMAQTMDIEALNELHEFAGMLAARPRFTGGPFDGLKIPSDIASLNMDVIGVSMPGHVMAEYEGDPTSTDMNYRFIGIRKTGEGAMPVFFPDSTVSK